MMRTESQRDLRIDLVKGIALLVLVSDHLPGNPLRKLMPVSWGLADMAEAFVLLSGVVAGLGVKRLRSWQACTKRRLGRASLIYAAYLITAFLLITMVRVFHIRSVAQLLPVALITSDERQLLISLVSLQGQVDHLCILLLYVWLSLGMVFLPDRIWKSRRMIFGAACIIYLGSQISPLFSLPDQLQKSTFYNPFAWQFLFLTGAIYSASLHRTKEKGMQSSWILPVALLIQGFLLISMGLNIEWPQVLISKSNLGILRYLHAVTAALIFKEILPRKFTPKWRRVFHPILRCSEQSLWVYCGGTLIVAALSGWMLPTQSLFQIVVINFITWCGCVCIALIAEKISLWMNSIKWI